MNASASEMTPVIETMDAFLRALCVWREFRGESDEARLACYWVICNRYLDRQKRWPRTIHQVVLQPAQFSSFNAGDPNAIMFPRESNQADWQAWQEICAMCDRPGDDPTGGANAYEAVPTGKPRPAWANASKLAKIIGNTRFYRL